VALALASGREMLDDTITIMQQVAARLLLAPDSSLHAASTPPCFQVDAPPRARLDPVCFSCCSFWFFSDLQLLLPPTNP